MFSENFWSRHKKQYPFLKAAWERVRCGGGKVGLKRAEEQEVGNSPSTNASENPDIGDIDDNQMEIEASKVIFKEETQDQDGFKKFDKELLALINCDMINWDRFENMEEYFSIEEMEDWVKEGK